MEIKSAKFIISNTNPEKCPKTGIPEYAFIGRSNVGKSSLINKLTNYNKLAKTSGQPGKTRLINHFLVNDEWYLVDLPGYGYAKVSKNDRKAWLEFIRNYILTRDNLYCMFVLVDVRHDPLKQDVEFINWLGENGVPFVLIFTKADKVTNEKVSITLERYKEKLLEYWEELPTIFVSSAKNGAGREEILSVIDRINKQ